MAVAVEPRSFRTVDAVLGQLSQLEADAASTRGSLGYQDEATLVKALSNSYGTPTIPARGFIQRGLVKARGFIFAVALDTKIADLLTDATKRYRSAIVEEIQTAGAWATQLAEETAEREGTVTPFAGAPSFANIQTEVTTSG